MIIMLSKTLTGANVFFGIIFQEKGTYEVLKAKLNSRNENQTNFNNLILIN